MKVKVTSEECYNAHKDFKVGKVPGADGFHAEFYRFFWPEIKKDMTESFILCSILESSL